MSKLRSNESEGIRFGKLMAEIYYFLSKHIINEMGEEKGSTVIRAAIKEFGEARVSSMKEEAVERGIEISNFEEFSKVKDMPNCGWENKVNDEKIITTCLFDEVWSKYGELGKKIEGFYCEIDHTLFNGFGFHLDRPKCKAAGDDECVFNVAIKKE